jgi:lipoprotein NlpI
VLINQASAGRFLQRSANGVLWLEIVNKRSNLASRLPQAIAQLDMTEWPAPVIRLFLGQLTPEAVLAAADNPDAKAKAGQVRQANFYSGELALSKGAKDGATRLFRLAADLCPKGSDEWRASRAELKALGLTP